MAETAASSPPGRSVKNRYLQALSPSSQVSSQIPRWGTHNPPPPPPPGPPPAARLARSQQQTSTDDERNMPWKRQWAEPARDIPKGKVSHAASHLATSTTTPSPSSTSNKQLFHTTTASSNNITSPTTTPAAPLVQPRNQWNAQEDIPRGSVKDNVWKKATTPTRSAQQKMLAKAQQTSSTPKRRTNRKTTQEEPAELFQDAELFPTETPKELFPAAPQPSSSPDTTDNSDPFFAKDNFENPNSNSSNEESNDNDDDDAWMVPKKKSTTAGAGLTKVSTRPVVMADDSWGAAASKSLDDDDDVSSSSWFQATSFGTTSQEQESLATAASSVPTASWSPGREADTKTLEMDIAREFAASSSSKSHDEFGFSKSAPKQDDDDDALRFEDFDKTVQQHLQQEQEASFVVEGKEQAAAASPNVVKTTTTAPFLEEKKTTTPRPQQRQRQVDATPNRSTRTSPPPVVDTPVVVKDVSVTEPPSQATVGNDSSVDQDESMAEGSKKSKRRGFFKMFSKRNDHKSSKSLKKSKSKSSRGGFRKSSALKEKQQADDVSSSFPTVDEKAQQQPRRMVVENEENDDHHVGSKLQLSPREGDGTVVSELSNPTIFNNHSNGGGGKGTTQQPPQSQISPSESLLDKEDSLPPPEQTEKENAGFRSTSKNNQKRTVETNNNNNATTTMLDPFDVNSPVFSSGADPFGFRQGSPGNQKDKTAFEDPFYASQSGSSSSRGDDNDFEQVVVQDFPEKEEEQGVDHDNYDDPEPEIISSDEEEEDAGEDEMEMEEKSSPPLPPPQTPEPATTTRAASPLLHAGVRDRSSPVPFDERVYEEPSATNSRSPAISMTRRPRSSASSRPVPRAEIVTSASPRKAIPTKYIPQRAASPSVKVTRSVPAPLHEDDSSITSVGSSASARRRKAEQEWKKKHSVNRYPKLFSKEKDGASMENTKSMWRGQGEESSLKTTNSSFSTTASAPFALKVSRSISNDRSASTKDRKNDMSSLGLQSSYSSESGSLKPRSILKKPRRALSTTVPVPQMENSANMDPVQLAGMRLLATAVTPIQAMIRRFLAEREALNRMFGLIVIQAYMRRWLVETRLGTNKSATKIQACVRRWMCYRSYRFFTSALKIQTFARQRNAEIDFLTKRSAAVDIQAAFRGWLIRDIIDDRHFCATQIQRIVRGYLATVSVYDDIYKVTLIQSFVRMKIAVEEATYRMAFVIQVQSIIRGYLVRRHLEKVQNSSVTIQRMWRGHSAAMNYRFDQLDIIIVQNVFRRRAARKELMSRKACQNEQDTERRERAAIVIQSQWRSYDDCMNYLHYVADVLIVQSMVRRWLAHKKVSRARNAATTIQKTWRQFWHFSNFLIMLDNAIRIQARVRSFLASKEMQRDMSSIVVVQTQCRSFLASKELSRLKSIEFMTSIGLACGAEQIDAASKIQHVWRDHYREQQRSLEQDRRSLEMWDAATTVQSAVRRSQAVDARRNKLVELTMSMGRAHEIASTQAATDIQTWWRVVAARNRAVAATKIQSATRRSLAINARRAKLLEWNLSMGRASEIASRHAAMDIQTWWRAQFERNQKRNHAALVVQRFFTIVKQTRAAIVIQSLARRQIAMRRTKRKQFRRALLQGRADEVKSMQAVTTIQRSWRAHSGRARIHMAATIIQRFFQCVRAEVARELELEKIRRKEKKKLKEEKRRQLQLENESATRLQAAWRGYVNYTDYLFTLQDVVVAQQIARGYLARKEAKEKLLEYTIVMATIDEAESRQAAVVLQRSWRGYQERCKVNDAARKIQRFFHMIQQEVAREMERAKRRQKKKQKRKQEKERQMKLEYDAASHVQAAWRGYTCRRYYTFFQSAVKIQSAWRGFVAYTDYVFNVHDIVFCQRIARGYMARKRVEPLILDILFNEAAMEIQRVYRGYQTRKEIETEDLEDYAAYLIQSGWRLHKMRNVGSSEELQSRMAATVIQRWWRDCSEQIMVENYAARVIQENMRLYCIRSKGSYEETRSRSAALMIETWWRMCLAKKTARMLWKERHAGLVILRFLRWVKAEVDREFARAEEKKRQRAMETDDDFLERIWNKTLTQQQQQDNDVISPSDIVRAEQAAANELRGAHGRSSSARRSTQPRAMSATRPIVYERSFSSGRAARPQDVAVVAALARPSSRSRSHRHVRANSETSAGPTDLMLPSSSSAARIIKVHDPRQTPTTPTPRRSRPPLLNSPPPPSSSSRRMPRSNNNKSASKRRLPAQSIQVRHDDDEDDDDDDKSEVSALTPQSLLKGPQSSARSVNDLDDFSLNQAWMEATMEHNNDPIKSPLLATPPRSSPTRSDASSSTSPSKRKSFRWKKTKAKI